MNDWDAFSSKAPPSSATEPSDTVSAPSPQRRKVRQSIKIPLSRQFVLLGLAGLVIAALASGITWFAVYHASDNHEANAIATTPAETEATATTDVNATATMQAVATATTAQQIYTQATSGTPAVDDPLTDNRNGWDQFVMDWGGECTFIKAATYQITIPNLGHSLLCTSSVLSHFDNFAMQISITPHQGDFAALVFGKNPNGYYSTDIHTDGEYALFDSVNSKFLIQGSSTAIIQGLNLTNVITIIVKNNQFYFYANGQLLTSNYLSNYVAGSIELAAVSRTQAPVDIAFSNLKIWTL